MTVELETKVQKTSLAAQIKDALLDRILDGRCKPGDRLVELTIAKEFGVSQAPVREALHILETMRLVESEPHRGTRVREISDREMSESTIVRGVLEEAAARSAAPRLKAHIPQLREEKQLMLEALQRHDLDGVARHSVNFHRLIVRSSDNNVLIESWEALAFETRSRILARRAAYGLMLEGINSCAAIIDAFEQGDGVTAGRLLREQTERCGVVHATVSTRISADDFQQALAAARKNAT